MKRSFIILFLVAIFAAACASTQPDEPAEVEQTTPVVTVFRTPT